MPHRASADPVIEAASYFTIGGGLAAIAAGTTGGGAPAMATGGMPNAVGGTNWLVATCCCNSVSGKGHFDWRFYGYLTARANARLSTEARMNTNIHDDFLQAGNLTKALRLIADSQQDDEWDPRLPWDCQRDGGQYRRYLRQAS